MVSWLADQSGQVQLVPTQEVQYLGYRISSTEKKVFLPLKKIEKMGQAVAQEAQIRDVMKVIGLMTSCILAVPWAGFRQRPLQGLLLRCWGGSQQGLDQPRPPSARVEEGDVVLAGQSQSRQGSGHLVVTRSQFFRLGCPLGRKFGLGTDV